MSRKSSDLNSNYVKGPTGRQRIFGLDVLRAFAIFCVVYGHGYNVTSKSIPRAIYAIPVLDGVTIFFVLSGFLIGRILLKMFAKDNFDGKMLVTFWIRRWFRTIPAYLLVLTFLVAYRLVTGIDGIDGVVGYYFFVQNLVYPHPHFFPEAWSLSVEEWFYLVSPLLVYLFTRFKSLDRKKIVFLWITFVIIAVTGFRWYRAYRYGYSSLEDWDGNLRKQVVTRLDSLMFGVIAAYLSFYKTKYWSRIAGRAFVAGIFLLVLGKVIWNTTHCLYYLNYIHLTLVSIGAFLLLPKLSGMKTSKGILAQSITYISLISYSMYLVNLSLVQGIILPRCLETSLLDGVGDYRYAIGYVLYWIFTIILASLIYHFFEHPVTGLREKVTLDNRAFISMKHRMARRARGREFLSGPIKEQKPGPIGNPE